MTSLTRFSLCACLAFASPAAAQPPAVAAAEAQAPQGAAACSVTAISQERVAEGHFRFKGNPVEIECPAMKLYAEVIDLDGDRVAASGNVVYTSPTNQIGADRVEYDLKARTGTFFNASGTASIAGKADRNMFGAQEPDAYFYGDEIEKVGPQTYRVTRGGFTTCVQPTPRWEFVATTVTVTLDERAVMWNAVLRVKNVPLFYLPVLYYPIEEDDRSTGFLLPTYGASTYRGQTLRNAFFWAINRSQDATVFWDWYSKTGNAYGAEYRYVAAPGSEGTALLNVLRENETVVSQSGGTTTILPARRSYQVRVGAAQVLGGGLRAQGNVDYFSTLTVLPAYHANIYDASQSTRTYGGIVSGTWGSYNLSGAYQVSELFYGANASTKTGGTPRISFNQSQRQIGSAPLFYAVGAQYERRVWETRTGSSVLDQSLSRVDANGSLRAPFNRISFLTWDSSVSLPLTYYSESLDANGQQVQVPIWRGYLDLRSEVTGPMFVRIWNTPASGYAERFKHLIEPSVEFRYLTDISNADSVVKTGATSDYIVGGNGQIRYRLTNRLLAKRKQESGPAVAREILAVSIQQTYYSDPAASRYDPSYSSSFGIREPSDFSPIAIGVSAAPTSALGASMSLEYDQDMPGVRSISLRGTSTTDWVQASAGWSGRRYAPTYFDHYLSLDATVRAPQNRVGGTYGLNYDFYRGLMVQQRILGYYNAQCCGIAVEYQAFQFAFVDPRYGVPKDRRFNISFTLAGIGTFASPFGAFGGAGGR
jgi:LPS-assembly protein